MDDNTPLLERPTVCTRCGRALTLVASVFNPAISEAICDAGHEVWTHVDGAWARRASSTSEGRVARHLATFGRQRLLAGLVEHMSDGVVVTDTDLNVVEYSGQSEQIYGWPREDIVGRHLMSLPTTFPNSDREAFHAALAEGRETRAAMRVRRRDGRWVDLDVVVTPMRDARGTLIAHLSVARDVTEQRSAERRLQDAHQQLAMVMDASNHGFWDWDIPSGHIEYSRRWAEMLGYRHEELEPTLATWERIVLPDDRQRIVLLMEAHLRGETARFEAEQRLRHKDGHLVSVISRGMVVHRDAQGHPLRFSGTNTDVTRRRTEEQRWRAYFESPAVGIAVADASDRFADVNRRFCEMLGYSRDELVTLTFADVTHPDDRGLHLDKMRAVMTGERDAFTLEKRYVRRDGSTLFAVVSVSVVRDPEGRVIQRLAVLSDVGALKQAEREALRTKEQLAFVLESSNDGYFDWNLATDVIDYSPRVAEMLGYGAGELTTPPYGPLNIIHPEDQPADRASLEAVLSGGREQHVSEARVRHKGGHWMWVLVRAKVVERDAGGAAVRMTGTVTDITARKQAEGSLRAALAANEQLVKELREALDKVKTLSGLLPICSSCKRIRDDRGLWERIEHYISAHTDATFTHGMCPDCLKKLYPELADRLLGGDRRDDTPADSEGWYRPK